MQSSKFYLFAVLSVLLIAFCVRAQERENVQIKDGLFIHVSTSYDNPHRLLMALKMATIMAADKDVLVYMDIEAVKILLKGSVDITHPEFESAHTYLKKLSAMGVGLYACPTCLKVAGYSQDDLMDGILPAEKDKFFSFTKGRIISLDY